MLWPLLAALLVAANPAPEPSHATSTFEIDEQAARDFQAADHDLNQAYQRLLPKLAKPARAKLQAAQLAWIPYRDAWADFRSDMYRGGTILPIVYTNTRRDLTEARRKDFDSVLANLATGGKLAILDDVATREKLQDGQLNAAYSLVRKDLDASGKALLTKAELAWIKYRDADAAFAAAWRTAQPARQVRAQRLYELTSAQTDALNQSRQP